MKNTEHCKATARPWVVKRIPTSAGQCFKVGSPEMVEASHGGICLYDDSTSLNPHKAGEQEANAALIVRAVNEYDALQQVAVAALVMYRELGQRLSPAAFNDLSEGAKTALHDALSNLKGIRKAKGQQ